MVSSDLTLSSAILRRTEGRMCGINGILFHDRERRVDAQILERMRAVQQHRGPDDSGLWTDGHVGFGFNRLSIIDLSTGHQPMTNDDGSVCLVFNGEIYNFRELRATLSSHGWRFRTQSDTEVILRAWEQWGEDCVAQLRGMFAFVLWDRRCETLFGARDRLGIKPFYYWNGPEGFAFASELKGLLECPWVPRRLDPVALEEYLRRRYVIAPRTMLQGVHKLPPGHCFTLRNGDLRLRPYWRLSPASPRKVTEQQAVEEFQALMEETVRMHLIADVPLGAFLSGGLDSTSIVGWMTQLGVQPVRTFSVGYNLPESELPYARIAATYFKTEHHELHLTPERLRDLLPKMVWHLDEPVGDEACIPLLYLAQFARQNVTVVLSGEGADELFAGYAFNYMRNVMWERWRAVPGVPWAAEVAARLPFARIRRRGAVLSTPLEKRYQGVSQAFTPEETSRLLLDKPQQRSTSVEETYRRCDGRDALSRMLFLDTATWLPDDLLTKADRMTMAASLELRVPFLDHKVVEFAWTLPSRFKIRRGVAKYLLKKAVEPFVPPEIVNREKKGFPTPLNAWFREELSGFSREVLLAPGGVTEFLSRQEIVRLLDRHQESDHAQQIYTLLVLDHWRRLFKPV